MKNLKILVVDDDIDILDVTESTLKDEYTIIKAVNGKEALEKIRRENPDLIILDYVLPDTEGVDICRELRRDPLRMHLPILMLTGKGEVDDKVKGLDAGVDDYMVKPFLPEELLARIRMLIRRSSTHLDANPLTRLPGNVSIIKELENKIKSGASFAILNVDLDSFKALNDYYGFERGDAVIRETARIIIEAIQKRGTPEDFIGHIGGDDFVIITKPQFAEDIAREIIATFDSTVLKFYDEQDRIRGYVIERSRGGELKKFGFLTISIGIVTNLHTTFTHVAQVTSLGAEAKMLAKKSPKSTYVISGPP